MNLSEYLDRAERGDPQATVLGLLKDLQAGRVKHEDVHAHYKAKNLPALNAMVEAFGKGNLFAAQRQDFNTWLRGDGWHRDAQTASDFRALEDLCGVKVEAVRNFYYAMVQGSPGARRNLAEKAGGEDELARQWGARTIREGWRW